MNVGTNQRARRVDGDEDDSLVQVKPYEFKYTQTKPKGDTVKLIFSLTNYPDRPPAMFLIKFLVEKQN